MILVKKGKGGEDSLGGHPRGLKRSYLSSCCLENMQFSGADLGKLLTDLLQNECRRRKLLGVTGAWPPEIFSILTT